MINSPILFNNYEVSTFENRVPFVYIDGCNLTVFISIDIVFHLHGFQNDDNLSLLYCIADIYFDIEDYTGKRRFYT